jgi:signal peptide peptidase SppA
MKQYGHILKLVRDTPWAIERSVFAVIREILIQRSQGIELSEDEIAERVGQQAARRPARVDVGSGVAVLPLYGVIMPKASLMTEMSGGTSVAAFRTAFRSAMADPEVGSILMDIDSPGGLVEQVPEVADEIRAARGTKPIVAIANTLAASAAYWIGAQADSFYITPSGQSGSIGVFAAHEDISVAQEKEGVKTTLISAGKFKTETSPFEPLSDEARARYQELVNATYGNFLTAVSKGRQVPIDRVRNGFGQGRVLNARESVAEGLADAEMTFDQVVSSMLGRRRRSAVALDRPDGATAATAASGVQVSVDGGLGPEQIGESVVDALHEQDVADEAPEIDVEARELNTERNALPERDEALEVLEVAPSGAGRSYFTVTAQVPGMWLEGIDAHQVALIFEGKRVASVAETNLEVRDEPEGLRIWARIGPHQRLRSLFDVGVVDTVRAEIDVPEEGTDSAKLRAITLKVAGAKGAPGRSPKGAGEPSPQQDDGPKDDLAVLRARVAERQATIADLRERVSKL